jgi:hypothetical protein
MSRKKINLIPTEFKNAQKTSRLRNIVIAVLLIPIIGVIYVGAMNVVLSKEVDKLERDIDTANDLKVSIVKKESMLKDRVMFIRNLEEENFPFYDFVKFIATKPLDGVTIFSVDTRDRLKGPEMVKKIQKNPDTGKEEEVMVAKEMKESIKNEIVIRGSVDNNNTSSIAHLIYNLSVLNYIKDVRLTGIEEKQITGKDEDDVSTVINAFEVVLVVK